MIDEYTGYRRGSSPKDKWHAKHVRMLRKAVKSFGLDPNKVRSNKAGPAIGGEVVYYDHSTLINLTCPFNGHGGEGRLLFRNDAGYCRRNRNGGRDTDAPNQPIPIGNYTAESLAELLRKLLGL